MNRGRILAASAAFFVLVGACAPPPKTQAPLHLLPSPSPTPTTAMAASAPSFHIGEVGVAYAPVGFTATGGLAPYKWSVVSGALPGGLNIGSDGSVSGTPTAGGDFAFTVAVADSGTQSTTVDGKISIAAPLTASLIPACAQYCNVELGCVNACGAFGSLSGGVGPFDFKLLEGDVPAGTSVVGLSLTGTFVGQSGWVQFTVQASDSLGATSTIAPKFWMYDHISLVGDSKTCLYIWTPCSVKLKITGGVPGGNPSVALVGEAPQPGVPNGCWNYQSPLPLPSGYTLTVSNGYVDVYIPRPGNGYGGIWSLVLTDHTLCAASTECTSQAAALNVGINCT